MLYHLSVDNLAVFVTVFINKRFLVLRHASQRHTHTGEASVVIKILHRNLFRQIGEHHHAISPHIRPHWHCPKETCGR